MSTIPANYRSYPTCRQILPAGRLCECPAIKGMPLCINHSRERQRQRNLAKAREVKNLSNPKRADYREVDDLNASIFESLNFPGLEDTAAVNITIHNIILLLGGNHISVSAAKAVFNACRIAEMNLRMGNAFRRTDMEPQLVDTDPVPLFGDGEGFVLPEEAAGKRGHDALRAEVGDDAANTARARLGFTDHLYEPLAYAGVDREQAAEQAYYDRKRAEEMKARAKADHSGQSDGLRSGGTARAS